jgi:hypothetical protein
MDSLYSLFSTCFQPTLCCVQYTQVQNRHLWAENGQLQNVWFLWVIYVFCKVVWNIANNKEKITTDNFGTESAIINLLYVTPDSSLFLCHMNMFYIAM